MCYYYYEPAHCGLYGIQYCKLALCVCVCVCACVTSISSHRSYVSKVKTTLAGQTPPSRFAVRTFRDLPRAKFIHIICYTFPLTTVCRQGIWRHHKRPQVRERTPAHLRPRETQHSASHSSTRFILPTHAAHARIPLINRSKSFLEQSLK